MNGLISINNGHSYDFVNNVWEEIMERNLWSVIENMMDEEIMRTVHYKYAIYYKYDHDRNKTFLNQYCIRHQRKYGEVFTIG